MVIPFKDLLDLVHESTLSKEEQEAFLSFFANAAQTELEPVIRFCREQVNGVEAIFELYKRKRAAIEQRDPTALKEIEKDEYRALYRLDPANTVIID